MPFSLKNDSKVGASAVWLSGGGTAFTPEAYVKSGGYRPIGREEDTLLASDMVKGGARVKDVTKKYPQLITYTRPRISLRTERGFGHTIAEWDKPDTPFASLPVENPESMRGNLGFYKQVDELLGKAGTKGTEQTFRKLCASYAMPDEKIGPLWDIFSRWDGRSSREEHFRFLEAARQFFKTTTEKIPMSTLLEMAEHESTEYSKAVQEATWSGQTMSPPGEEWVWSVYSKTMTELLAETGLDMNNADTRTKVWAIIVSEYVPHYEPVVRNGMFVVVNELRKNMKSRTNPTPDEQRLAKARGLSKFTLKEYHRFNLCQMEAAKISVFQETQRTLKDELSPQVKKNIDTMLTQFRSDYDDFVNAIINDPRDKAK